MCGHGLGPPFGIPIPPEVYEQYPTELKRAWEIFDGWFTQMAEEDIKKVTKESMPKDVQVSYDLICSTPIPGYEELGSESCQIVMINEIFETNAQTNK